VTAHLTEAEARALGLDVPKKKTRTTRKTGAGPYHTRCTACSSEFTTAASEDRHLAETHHSRYELVLT